MTEGPWDASQPLRENANVRRARDFFMQRLLEATAACLLMADDNIDLADVQEPLDELLAVVATELRDAVRREGKADTKRLDWLERTKHELLTPLAKDAVSPEHRHESDDFWHVPPNAPDDQWGEGPTARAALDAAMAPEAPK